MTDFAPVADLKVGHVTEVSGTTVKVKLSGLVSELTKNYGGRVYEIGQIGSVVKIHFGRRIIFGFVTLLRMEAVETEHAADGRHGATVPDQRIMEVDLFAQGQWSSGRAVLQFERGVTSYPLPQQGVYILTDDENRALYAAAERRDDDGVNPLVPIGRYVGAASVECRANIDKLFSTHCAIMGSTGSGKSGAVAAVLHGVVEHQAKEGVGVHPRIVVIDPHGEYASAFRGCAKLFRAYDTLEGEEVHDADSDHIRIRLPYWLMSADEFRALVIGKTEHEATSQHNIIYKALTHARMVAAGITKATFTKHGVAAPADELPLDGDRLTENGTQDDIGRFDRDRPRPFCLDELCNHIRFAQAARVQKDVTAAITETDFSAKGFKSILDKLDVLRRDPRVGFMMTNWTTEDQPLAEILAQLVGDTVSGDENRPVRVIDISGLPNEVAGPLTAVVARLLFQFKIHQFQRERENDPLVLVCEEAHRYVPDRGEAEYAVAQTAIRRIAREGRKYGVGLMLVSQRPADIESTVISQCGSWIVLRLTNSADQAHVARFLPDGLSGMVRTLPSLGQQEALFVGEAAALPARIRIRDLPRDKLPRSTSVSYAKGWLGERAKIDGIKIVADRMQRDPG